MTRTPPIPPRRYVTLAEIALRHRVLHVTCNRCDRRGQLRVDRLIAEHGPALPVPKLRRIIAADCPRTIANAMHDPCGAHFHGLAVATRGDG